MKEELTKEELYALARMKKVEVATLNRLRDCLDTKNVRKKLIAYEFKHLVKERIFKKRQIIYATKTNKGRKCVRCGKLITAYKWGRNNGVCDNCIAKAIKNYDLYCVQGLPASMKKAATM